MNNVKYYNDNLAYDFNLFLPRENKRAQTDSKVIPVRANKKRAARRAASVVSGHVTAVVVTTFVLFSLFAAIYMRARITEISRDISTVKSEITVLETEKTRLYVELENKISYKNIEEAAQTLGMRKMDNSQVVYIRLNDTNKAVNSKGELTAQNN